MSRFLRQTERPGDATQPVRSTGRPVGAAGEWHAGCGWPKPGRSVYEGRFAASGPVTIVMTRTGKFLGVERGGGFEPAKPCCADARECHRPECWTPLGGGAR